MTDYREKIEQTAFGPGRVMFNYEDVPELQFFHHADALRFAEWYEEDEKRENKCCPGL